MATTPHVPPQVTCSATGGKLLTPPMTDTAACARFVGAVQAASAARVGGNAKSKSGGQKDERLSAELHFLPRGIAVASVTRIGAGTAAPPLRFELAVSDRGFRAGDIDRLARDVVVGMFDAPRR